MTKLFKNSKQVLSFVLAFAVLAVSLFTGVAISSDAACDDTTVIYWDGSVTSVSSFDELGGKGTSGEPYVIDSAADLALIASATIDSANMYFKVADGIDAIVLQPESIGAGILSLTSASAVKDYFEDTNKTGFNEWVRGGWSTPTPFIGSFDGNGVEIYGLYANTPNDTNPLAGLFTQIDAGAAISNVTVKNSYINSKSYAAFIAAYSGGNSQGLKKTGTVSFSKCIVANCYMVSNVADCTNKAGVMTGTMNEYIKISDCMVYGNDANNIAAPYKDDSSIKGFKLSLVGDLENVKDPLDSITNCICLGTTPYPQYNCGYNNLVDPNASMFSNVYTDQATEDISLYLYDGTGYKYYNKAGQVIADSLASITESQILSKNAMDVMPGLDWENTWLVESGKVPEFKSNHNMGSTATKGTNGHTYKCADCELVTAEYPHTYGADGVCTACGATQKCGENVIYWDAAASVSTADDLTGTGDVDDPFIIDSVADLAYVAQGADGDTDGEYYKIADGIDALVLQEAAYADAIMALDNATAVETYFTTNKSSMKQWATTTTSTTTGFKGILDGNGATIYGLYDNGAYNYGHGLFSMGRGFTVNDLAFKNSYVYGDNAAILCGISKEKDAKFYVNGCIFTNNVVICARLNDENAGMGGLMVGSTSDGYIYIDGCLVYGNSARHSDTVDYWPKDANNQSHMVTIDKYDAVYGLWGAMSGPTQNAPETNNTVSNSVILDTAPYSLNWSYDGHCTTYTNVYTNMTDIEFVNTHSQTTGKYEDYKTVIYTYNVTVTTDENGTDISFASYVDGAETPRGTITTLDCDIRKIAASDIQGASATEKLDLDWAGTWFAVEDDMPTLRTFHKDITAVDNEDGTHSESCNCGLVGATAVAHTFDKAATGGTCSACGAACTTHGMGDPNYDAQLGAFDWIESEKGTCDTAPKGQLVCSICGFSSPAGIDYPYFEAGHKNIKHVDAEEPTCTEDGTVEHWHCDDCGNNYTTEAATTKLDSIVDPTEGHKAVVDDKGNISYYMDEVGYHAKTCSVCGENFERTECSGSSYEKDADGHIGTCDTCGMGLSDKQDHIFDENKQDTNNTCLTCGWTCESHGMGDPNYDAQLGAFDWNESVAGDCDTAPKGQLVCSICGFSSPAGIDYPYFEAKEHVEGKPEESDREESSCTEDGSYVETIKCTECDEVISTTTKTIDKKGHNFIAFDGYDADCTYTGEIPHKWCDVCYEHFDADEIDVYSTDYKDYATDIMTPVVPDAHIWVEVEAKDASCEEDGNVEYKYCELCTLLVVGDKETELAVFDDTFYEKLEKAWDENITDDMTEEEYEEVWPPIYYSILGDAVEEAAAEEGIELTIAGGHKLTEVKEVAATTEKEGTKAHYTCSECDKLFADAEGKTEVKAADLVIAKLAAEDKGNDKTDDNKTETKPDGDKSNESPKTGESVAVVAAVAALMGAAFVIIRKARKA